MSNKEYTKQGKIDRSWGYELVWSSNQYYCGKILVFEKVGVSTTLSIHKDKKKSWFVNSGRFKITFTDVQKGKEITAILDEGKTVDIGEMSPHRVEALQPNSMIFEVGTPDDLADQFRLTPDDNQKSSEEPK
jgi:mannose-6-phosphate isomerase-like protein (cupin superfamily)